MFLPSFNIVLGAVAILSFVVPAVGDCTRDVLIVVVDAYVIA
jgi:hypothetical protein